MQLLESRYMVKGDFLFAGSEVILGGFSDSDLEVGNERLTISSDATGYLIELLTAVVEGAGTAALRVFDVSEIIDLPNGSIS